MHTISKLCGAIDMLEKKDAFQRDLNRLARWSYENLVQVIKAKRKVLHLALGSSMQKYGLGGEWIERSPGKKIFV